MTYKNDRPINLMELRATYTTGGGPDKTILLSAEKHDKTIINPIVVYLRDARDTDFQIGKMAAGRGFTYIEVLDRQKIDLKCIWELYHIARSHNIDIVHGHDYKTDPLAFLLKVLKPDLKIMSTAHGWITNTRRTSLYKWIHLIFLRRFKKMIAVSNATRDLMIQSGISREKITVLYNGIDAGKWRRENVTEDLKVEFGIPLDARVVGAVGRLGDEKDYYSLLDVAETVNTRLGNVYFMIVGDGKTDEKEKLLNHAKAIGVDEKIVFTGYRSDLLTIYNSFDIFISTSLTEGLPNNTLEAMSMGLPVVVTNVGGVSELVQAGISGYLFEPRDVNGISQKIIDLLADDAALARVSHFARKRIEEKFTFDRRLKAIEGIYQEIMQ